MLKTRWQPNFVSLQGLMGRILPMIHSMSLHCRELYALRAFAHNCQHDPTYAEPTTANNTLEIVVSLYTGLKFNEMLP